MNFDPKPISAGLYFVATPIGSARDITLRALDLLAGCDVIAAEDTRTARKLMEIHGVPLGKRPVLAYHDHSGDVVRARIVAAIAAGKSVAYVSEAGTPLVADPGFALGRAVISAGLPLTAAPGASAVLAALAVSGLPTDRFLFVGFLASAKVQRDREIAELRDLPFTLVMYESPKRINDMLHSLLQIMGDDRQAVVCRELTKRFEQVSRGTLAELVAEYGVKVPRGEIVVLVGRAGATEILPANVEAALREAMKNMRMKDAANLVAGAMGLSRRQVYQTALKMEPDE